MNAHGFRLFYEGFVVCVFIFVVVVFICGFRFMVCFVLCFLWGVRDSAVSVRIQCVRAICITNRRNKGLTSADRRTSLLSCLQYPVPYQSRLQRIYSPSVPERRLSLVLGRSLSLRVNTAEREYRRFPAWILT